MRHRLTWFLHLRAQGLSKGDEHATNSPHGYGILHLYLGELCKVLRLAVSVTFYLCMKYLGNR